MDKTLTAVGLVGRIGGAVDFAVAAQAAVDAGAKVALPLVHGTRFEKKKKEEATNVDKSVSECQSNQRSMGQSETRNSAVQGIKYIDRDLKLNWEPKERDAGRAAESNNPATIRIIFGLEKETGRRVPFPSAPAAG